MTKPQAVAIGSLLAAVFSTLVFFFPQHAALFTAVSTVLAAAVPSPVASTEKKP